MRLSIIKKYFLLTGRLLKAVFQLSFATLKVSNLPNPAVSIFGGTRMRPESIYAQQAHRLAYMLVQNDISVITGGGPGVMEAANCGALHASEQKPFSYGITVQGLEQAPFNPCVQESIVMDFFFARKWLLIQYSVAYVFFPGGFGTLDELMELVTLIQTYKIKRSPVVLIGISYWKPFLDWIYQYGVAQGYIPAKDTEVITLTDSLDEAFAIVKERCEKCRVGGE